MGKAAAYLALAAGVLGGKIPAIRVEHVPTPRPPRKGDAEAICRAEEKRARKRAKRLGRCENA